MNTSKYNKAYYEKKKKALQKKRRAKYKKDKQYRASALLRSRVQYVLRATKFSPRVAFHNGKWERLFTLPEIAQETGLSSWLLREWRTKKIIPQPLYRVRKTIPGYSHSQVLFLSGTIAQANKLVYPQVGMILKKVWGKTFSQKVLNIIIREVSNGKE